MSDFFDHTERLQLADLLDLLGPEAPTLLEPWTTRAMAAHVILRDHDSLAAPGLVLPGAWRRLAERRQQNLAQRDFTELIATLRSETPPGVFRLGWVRRFPSLNELFVHHEDVRRANGRGPRAHEPAMNEALWHNVTRSAWFLSRRLRRTGLEVCWAGTGRTVRARRGEPVARITGDPGELLLYLFGRQSAAHVEVSGTDAAIGAVDRTHFGM
jgi:uncharacterized protein (TIGR03085 family)